MELKSTCHPGQAMRQHRAEPGSILQAAQWIPDSRFAASGMTKLDKTDHKRLYA
jgi:hypothetical protein